VTLAVADKNLQS